MKFSFAPLEMLLLACVPLLVLKSTSILHAAPLPEIESTASAPFPNPELTGCDNCDQGDMVREPSDALTGRGVSMRPASTARWPGGVVPYEFASNITVNNSAFIVQQMRAMESLTSVNNTPCIQFRPRNATDLKYITILNGSGCNSLVGFGTSLNGSRPVSLMHSSTSTCMVSGTVQHELTHALGFFHEQSRPDRDLYVNIYWSNINPSQWFNFDKYNSSQVDTLMTSYDYSSVMHYGKDAFSINSSSPAIEPTMNSSAFIGQRVRLSPTDILEIQLLYGCVPMPTTTTTTTSTTTTATTATTTTSTTSTTTTSTSAATNATTTVATVSTPSAQAVTTGPLTIALAVTIPCVLALAVCGGVAVLCIRRRWIKKRLPLDKPVVDSAPTPPPPSPPAEKPQQTAMPVREKIRTNRTSDLRTGNRLNNP